MRNGCSVHAREIANINVGAIPRGCPEQAQEPVPTETQIREALKDVNDPEMPISLVDMGMIYDVCVKSHTAHIQLGLTATACPAIEFIFHDIRERLFQEGFKKVEIELVWDPPWTKDRISEEGRIALQHWGISV
ncbi:metal-sulfur cluster assembly factor [Candidatus Acetothermia bacterium]|nr:metal-sulfur cluster assembly factor [Candidatus Acetothermia bacterium]MBI3459997.1 metal-sulfur cluster assembly factor [Candidatus Acetothermia bacterium]MBI3659399.1 metal-sulfur cluster assembly factor [Candidatus Acetothermia bacterium]